MIEGCIMTKGLIIKEPWVSLIVEGKKTWELRKTKTSIRGKIALLQGGYIRGYANLVDCIGPIPLERLREASHLHQVPIERFTEGYSYKYAWKLINVESVDPPEKYDHPRGAQQWVNL